MGDNPDGAEITLVPDLLETVVGFDAAASLHSRTTADGKLRLEPIDGVKYRLARPVSHYHGHLTEVFRNDWGLTDFPVVQVNLTTTFPGRTRAWGLHRHTFDRLFVASGSFCIVCYDARRDSPTFTCANEFIFAGRNQGVVVIPPGVYHGWKNIGDEEGTIISLPSQLYNHNAPDRWELPWDSAAARAAIPYRWP